MDDKQKVYVAQWKSKYDGTWNNYTTKAGNALHKTYGQALAKVRNGGRVITYSLVEEVIETFEEEV